MALDLIIVSGCLITLAIGHSLLGERYLLGPLLALRPFPKLGVGERFSKATLRFAWHLTSLAWLAIAAMLMWPEGALVVVAGLLGVSGVITHVCTRGRHFAWAIFLAGALAALSLAVRNEQWQSAVSVAAAAVFVALGALHLCWAFGLRTGMRASVPVVHGRVAFTPSRSVTLLVAAGLFLFGWLALALVDLVSAPLGGDVLSAAGALVAAVFAARTIGDFRLVGLFKRVHGTPFARWDDLLYTPLSFALSAALLLQLG